MVVIIIRETTHDKQRPSPDEERAWAKEVVQRKADEAKTEMAQKRADLVAALGNTDHDEWIVTCLDEYLGSVPVDQ